MGENTHSGIEQMEVLHDEKSARPVKRLLTPLLSKKVPPVPEEPERKVLPIQTRNLISRLLFLWLIPLYNRGYKRTLDNGDLWKLGNRLSINTTFPRFQHNLNRILKYNQKKGQAEVSHISVSYALFWTFKTEYTMALLLSTLAYSCQVVIPVLIKRLIDVVKNRVLIPSTPINDGVGYALGIVILLAISGLSFNHALKNSKLVGALSKSILTKALMEKSFITSAKGRYEYNNGKVFTLASSDLAKIDLAISFSPLIFSTPLPVIAGIALLIINIGVSALTGIAFFIVGMALVVIPGALMMKYRTLGAKYTDQRVGLMREVLNSMKMIKLYAWENAYQEKIIDARSQESNFIFKVEWATNVIYGVVFNLSPIASMISFLVLHSLDSSRGSAGSVFSSLALFNILMNLTSDFPMLLSYCTAGWVSIKRITDYLRAPTEVFKFEETGKAEGRTAIKVNNATFEWENFEDNEVSGFSLENVNLEVEKGSFIVVTGSTGSGKSSLLHAIKGDMPRLEGDVAIDGSSIMCGTPWIQSTTIRDNIVFGSKFDAVLYRNTIQACALEVDINSLPAGDMTKVGERGVTLSGGQKARISLARAIYAQKDIFLLDDVLSAVDAKVGRHIVEKCLMGFIGDKTRILATHQLSLILEADSIIFVNDDGSLDIGDAESLLQRNAKFASLMNHNKASGIEDKENFDKHEVSQLPDFEGIDGDLFQTEEKAVNAIPFSIYKQYLEAGSGFLSWMALPALIFFTMVAIFLSMFANVWLSFWMDERFGANKDGLYIGLYVTLNILAWIFTLLDLFIMGYLIVNSSKVLNLNAVKRVLHTPMSFTDTTPSGRILNRFTKDTNSLDNEIGVQLKILIYFLFYIVGIMVMCVVYLPWFAIAIPLIIMIFGLIANFYQASSREVKRLEALSRSHVFQNFNEVLNGMETIKSYHSEYRFMELNDVFVDRLNESYLVTIANQRWISVTLNLVGCGIVLIITMLALTRQFNISAASTGLITTYILDFSGLLSLWLTAYSEVENEMNSVERLCHYANNLEQEAAYEIPGRAPPPEWPQSGNMKFKNVSLRYRENLPLVLKDLNLNFAANEKIGICGRTGAGKSSLIYAIYRLTELAEGSIEIDGVDVKGIGLHDLRSKLSIIPQDPVLFEGSIRKNLDPFDEHQDDELWNALRRSGLGRTSDTSGENNAKSKFHLEAVVEDGGSNFSLGERQLLALARALVRSSKILIMDEATSSVDYETDALVQETIAREFRDCTILCIAHRLKTILKYDRILVLENGEVKEFDEPIKLFNKKGHFREMCDSSKITAKDFM